MLKKRKVLDVVFLQHPTCHPDGDEHEQVGDGMKGDEDSGLQDDAGFSPVMLSKADLSLVPVSIVVRQIERQRQVLQDPAHLISILPELLADHQLAMKITMVWTRRRQRKIAKALPREIVV